MLDEIKKLHDLAINSIRSTKSVEEIENLRVRFLGKKGELTHILKGMRDLAADVRPKVGEKANEVKEAITGEIQNRLDVLRAEILRTKLENEKLDVSLPVGTSFPGCGHPISQTIEKICTIFHGLGFAVEEGPEIETDYYNFTALNFPDDHPARDMQDTFFLQKGYLLRTHTSPVQIRAMEKRKPPIKILVPGRVYRHDADTTHSPVFHQVEGLLIDKDTTMADLKGALSYFIDEMFGRGSSLRFRPSFFPFTEPSIECDMLHKTEEGGSKWMEILGAGMVDPNVLKAVGYDPEVYQGFAFGMGVERIAMIYHGISDIRLFYDGALPFLEQFR